MSVVAAVPGWAWLALVAGVAVAVRLLVVNARELAWYAAQDAADTPVVPAPPVDVAA